MKPICCTEASYNACELFKASLNNAGALSQLGPVHGSH